MSIVCFIRYDIDPFQRAAFKTYAETWGVRARLKEDAAARENFAFAQTHRFIQREERTFLELVDATLALPSTYSPS
jgi:hypothetical protein